MMINQSEHTDSLWLITPQGLSSTTTQRMLDRREQSTSEQDICRFIKESNKYFFKKNYYNIQYIITSKHIQKKFNQQLLS